MSTANPTPAGELARRPNRRAFLSYLGAAHASGGLAGAGLLSNRWAFAETGPANAAERQHRAFVIRRDAAIYQRQKRRLTKTRLRLFSLVLFLAYQTAALGQTCAQKIARCQQGCDGLPNPKLVQPCRINCIKTACGAEHTPPPPPPPPLAWDVVAPNDGTEQFSNGFLRNPQWGWALTNPTPLLDICDSCPCDNQDPSSWNTPNCTRQFLHQNGPQTLNPFCFLGGGTKSYHMNWFPVEIDGSLRWEDHSTVFDNDYQFDILSPNRSLLGKNRPDDLHVEFDSVETVNDWGGTGTWWENFHTNVVDNLKDKDKIASWFGKKFAIVIGMVGIDMEHGPHSELHPVYAMFINLGPEGPRDAGPQGTDHWAFFVRNWGNEGYCGSGDEPLNDFREIAIPLPETEIVRSNVTVYAHGDYSADQCSAETSVINPDAKGLMVFMLPPATAKCGVVGDLFMRRTPTIRGSWASMPESSRRSTVVSVSGEEGEDIDPRLMATIAKLDPVARQELYKQLSDIMKEPSSRPTKRIGTIKTTPPSSSGVAEEHPQFTGQGLKAVPNPAFEAKQAKQRQLIDAFLKAHGVQ